MDKIGVDDSSSASSCSSMGHHRTHALRLGPSSSSGHPYQAPAATNSPTTTLRYSNSAKNGLKYCKKPQEFHEKLSISRQWFTNFDDDEKNVFLRELLALCGSSQIHVLSSLLEPRLHQYCPPNCQDPFVSLPFHVAIKILSFLDPVSLCRCVQVCRCWRKLCEEQKLWKTLCNQPRDYRLSSFNAEEQHKKKFTDVDGTVRWRNIFAERYRWWRNWNKGRCVVRTFEGHTQGISCVQFDEDHIVSGSSDSTIKVWDIRTNNPLAVMNLTGHSATVRCLQLDGNHLASGSSDNTLKVWDLSLNNSWSSIACKVTMVGHLNSVRCLQMDDTKIVSGSYDTTLKLWDLNTGQCRSTLRGHDEAVLCLQFDDRKIVSGSADNTIKIWDLVSGQCILTLHNAHQNAVTCLQFDERRIVTGSLDCTIKFWDVRTGRWLNTLDWMQHEGHTGVIRCLQADSWRIVSAADDKTLKVWNLHTGKRIITLKSHTDGVTCLQFSDLRIVSGSYDKTVKLWDFSIC
uniref:F-box domain-containing protein n=1 Tax=Romanomermis culicivorax TaxID=13658 RepID=A0A915KXB9_ROMCU